MPAALCESAISAGDEPTRSANAIVLRPEVVAERFSPLRVRSGGRRRRGGAWRRARRREARGLAARARGHRRFVDRVPPAWPAGARRRRGIRRSRDRGPLPKVLRVRPRARLAAPRAWRSTNLGLRNAVASEPLTSPVAICAYITAKNTSTPMQPHAQPARSKRRRTSAMSSIPRLRWPAWIASIAPDASQKSRGPSASSSTMSGRSSSTVCWA